MYMFLSNTGFTKRNTLFIFVWLRPRNTWIPIQHVGWGVKREEGVGLHAKRGDGSTRPPSIGVKWGGWFFVWSFVVLFWSCVCVCDPFFFYPGGARGSPRSYTRKGAMGWPLHEIAIANIVCWMTTQGGRGKTIYCAILIAKYNRGGAMKDVLNAKKILTSAQFPSKQTNTLWRPSNGCLVLDEE